MATPAVTTASLKATMHAWPAHRAQNALGRALTLYPMTPLANMWLTKSEFHEVFTDHSELPVLHVPFSLFEHLKEEPGSRNPVLPFRFGVTPHKYPPVIRAMEPLLILAVMCGGTHADKVLMVQAMLPLHAHLDGGAIAQVLAHCWGER